MAEDRQCSSSSEGERKKKKFRVVRYRRDRKKERKEERKKERGARNADHRDAGIRAGVQ